MLMPISTEVPPEVVDRLASLLRCKSEYGRATSSRWRSTPFLRRRASRAMTLQEQLSVTDFYTDSVLPVLSERLDQAFPEFGWRRDARGWIATNEEHTHSPARRSRRARCRARAGAARLPRPRRRADALDGIRQRRRRSARRGVRSRRQGSRASRWRRLGADRAAGTARSPSRSASRLLRALPPGAGAEGGAGHASTSSGADSTQTDRTFRPRRRPRRRLDTRRSSRRPGTRIRRSHARSRRFALARTALRRMADEHGRSRHALGSDARGRDESPRLALPLPPRREPHRPSAVRTLGGVEAPPSARTAMLVLVEGLLDVHHSRSRGVENVAALGGTRNPSTDVRATFEFGRRASDALPRPGRARTGGHGSRGRTCSARETKPDGPRCRSEHLWHRRRIRTASSESEASKRGQASSPVEICGITWRRAGTRHRGAPRLRRSPSGARRSGVQARG